MNSFRLAIIGAGQIGSRHLQALANVKFPAEIYLVDPSEASLGTAVERFSQIKGKVPLAAVYPLKSMDLLPDSLDLAIVATSSDVRRDILDSLLARKYVNNLILEKFLFQKVKDYAHVASLLESKGIKAWVNCPLRMVDFYQEIKSQLFGCTNLAFEVTGSQIGIGCNSIHFLDLMSFMTGDSGFSISPGALRPELYPSKRAGFSECCGTLTGVARSGNFFSITSLVGGATPVAIQITTESRRIQIQIGDSDCLAWLSGQDSNWQNAESRFKIPFQSQLTHLAAEDILLKGRSQLPSYAESAPLHLAILEPLLSHFNTLTHKDALACPIT